MSEAISGGLLVFFLGFPDIAEPFIRPCYRVVGSRGRALQPSSFRITGAGPGIDNPCRAMDSGLVLRTARMIVEKNSPLRSS